MVGMALTSLLSGALITGAIFLQKSFVASRHHIIAQAQQMRLLDYMNLDLRRALTVSTVNGRLTMTIPDYYDSSGKPRDPSIQNGMAVYGTAPRTVTYYKDGEKIYRSDGGPLLALASDVSDFQLAFQDLGQSIRVTVNFLPRYQFSTNNREKVRAGTTTFTTTLLRNKRQG
jgi:hypothetical protein